MEKRFTFLFMSILFLVVIFPLSLLSGSDPNGKKILETHIFLQIIEKGAPEVDPNIVLKMMEKLDPNIVLMIIEKEAIELEPNVVLKMVEKGAIDIDPNNIGEFLEEMAKRKEEREKEHEQYLKERDKRFKELKGKWRTVLVEAIKDADKIEIKSTFFYQQDKLFHTIQGNDKIQEFINILDIDEPISSFHCGCYGSARLVFSKENTILATLSYHHNQSLRWYGGAWVGDAWLTKKSRERLPGWFESQGYSGFADIDRQILAEKKKAEQFMKYFPEEEQKKELNSSIENPIKDKLKELNEKYNDKEVAKIYSSSLAMASITDFIMETEFVRLYLGHFKGESFSNALTELENNKQSLVGAARVYFRYISFLDDPDIEKGDCKLTDEEKEEFGIRLAPYILNADGNWQKRLVVEWLSETDNQQASSMLFDIARGKTGKEVNHDDWFERDEPGIKATAYLSLAQRKDLSDVEEIREALKKCVREQDIAVLKLALCLLGDNNTFDENYFKYDCYTLGNAALKVIEKYPTRENVDILVNTGIEHGYGMVSEEAKYLFQKVTNVDWLPSKEGNGKDIKRLSYRAELRKIRKWWKENRENF